MKIVKYIDVVTTEVDDDGQPIDVVHARDIGVPEHIDKAKITNVGPYFTKNGRLFKNVSIIIYEGMAMKVVGNYDDIQAAIENKPKTITGFKYGGK